MVAVGVPVDVADVIGGDASTGLTRPTCGTTGRVGRTGVTPFSRREKSRDQVNESKLVNTLFWDTVMFSMGR